MNLIQSQQKSTHSHKNYAMSQPNKYLLFGPCVMLSKYWTNTDGKAFKLWLKAALH